MGKGDLPQDFFAAMREPQKDVAAVGVAACSLQQAVRLQAVDKLHGAVMLDLQSFSEDADGRFERIREALNGEQGLILLWFDTCRARGLLAEILKPPDFVTEFGERFVVDLFVSSCSQGRRNYIVRRWKIEGRDRRRFARMCSTIQQREGAVREGAVTSLECFAEGFLSFIDAVAQIFIETVRGFANHVGPQADDGTTLFARPIFSPSHELGTDTTRARCFVDHESADFDADVRADGVKEEQVGVAGEFAVRMLGHKDNVFRIAGHFPQTRFDLLVRGGIAELAGKHSQAGGVS